LAGYHQTALRPSSAQHSLVEMSATDGILPSVTPKQFSALSRLRASVDYSGSPRPLPGEQVRGADIDNDSAASPTRTRTRSWESANGDFCQILSTSAH